GLPDLGRLLVAVAADALLELLVLRDVLELLEPEREVGVVRAQDEIPGLAEEAHRLAPGAETLDLLEVGIQRAADHHLRVADAAVQLRRFGAALDGERPFDLQLALLD